MTRWRDFMTTLLVGAHFLTAQALAEHLGPPDVIGNPPPSEECNVDLGAIGIGPPDPGAPGPFTVVFAEYDFGDAAANLPDFDDPVEFRARYAYPEELACGPFPIVFIMHGNHAVCYDTQTLQWATGWPCQDGDAVLPNYRGYDYLAQALASHGIITVSISANGINAGDSINLDARAELFKRHAEYWRLDNTSADSPFFGRVDMNRIGVLGHSRGGAGAARFVDLYNAQDFPIGSLAARILPHPIKAVLLVGAVAGGDLDTIQVTDTALGTLYPYCDGDQEEIPSVAYYDGSRYASSGDIGPKHSFLVIGANHNYYNTFWDDNATDIEAVDDWVELVGNEDGPFCQLGAPGSGRLTSAEQRATLIAISSAFFRTYLRGETAFRAFLRAEAPPPPSAMTEAIFVGYHPKHEERRDVNRLTEQPNLEVNTLGGAVSAGGLVRYEFCDVLAADGPNGCLYDETPAPFNFGSRRPHDASEAPVTQLRIAWESSPPVEQKPAFINELPPDSRDLSAMRAFQFRAFVDFTDPLNPVGQPQNLRVVLRDGADQAASVPVATHSPALFFPPSVEALDVPDLQIPRAILNTVRVPLAAFDGVFLTDIRRVELVFDQTESGAINLADVAFADEAPNKPPDIACTIAEPQLDAGGDKLINVGLSVPVADDHDPSVVPQILVYSDEDDTDSANHQSSPDAKDLAPETLRLRAEFDKSGDGRVYLVLAKASDSEGARRHACCTATVPAGKQADDIQSAHDQAMAAGEMCTTFAAASEGLAPIPTGYFVVGDGPVLGPNQ